MLSYSSPRSSSSPFIPRIRIEITFKAEPISLAFCVISVPPVSSAIDCSNELFAALRAEADLVNPSPSDAASVAKLFYLLLSVQRLLTTIYIYICGG